VVRTERRSRTSFVFLHDPDLLLDHIVHGLGLSLRLSTQAEDHRFTIIVRDPATSRSIMDSDSPAFHLPSFILMA
jgi:hypothetical protein